MDIPGPEPFLGNLDSCPLTLWSRTSRLRTAGCVCPHNDASPIHSSGTFLAEVLSRVVAVVHGQHLRVSHDGAQDFLTARLLGMCPHNDARAIHFFRTFLAQGISWVVSVLLHDHHVRVSHDGSQDFKTAHLLGVCPRAQFAAMLLGSAVSAAVSVAAYSLYTSAWQVPGPDFPAPTAEIWLDMADLVRRHFAIFINPRTC